MPDEVVEDDNDDDDAEVESTETLVSQNHDYVTWKQIREDAHRYESISKVEMLSDLAGLSSLDEGNSTTDEFEYNERMVRSSRSSSARIEEEEEVPEARDNDALNDRTYVIDETQLQSLNNDDSEEDDLSCASTKTFRKSEAEFAVSLDLCQRDSSEESNENKEESPDDVEPVVENKAVEAPGLSKEIRQRPKKCHSMPNIADVRARKCGERPNVEALEIIGNLYVVNVYILKFSIDRWKIGIEITQIDSCSARTRRKQLRTAPVGAAPLT